MRDLSPSELAALISGTATRSSLANEKGITEAEVAALAEAALRRALEPKRTRSLRAVGAVAALALVVAFAKVAYAQACTPGTRTGGLWVFCPNSPALATEANDNFSQLRTWSQQTAALLGVSTLPTGGGALVQSSPATVAGVNVGGNASINGNETVSGTANISGNAVFGSNATVTGTLTALGGVVPDWDSGWVNTPGNADVTLTHGLGVVPSHVQVWFRDSGNASWVNPATFYDEGGFATNGPTYALSTSQIRYRVRTRPISFFNYSGAGVYQEAVVNSGQYRFLLWK